jgi:hypothetical protein
LSVKSNADIPKLEFTKNEIVELTKEKLELLPNMPLPLAEAFPLLFENSTTASLKSTFVLKAYNDPTDTSTGRVAALVENFIFPLKVRVDSIAFITEPLDAAAADSEKPLNEISLKVKLEFVREKPKLDTEFEFIVKPFPSIVNTFAVVGEPKADADVVGAVILFSNSMSPPSAAGL